MAALLGWLPPGSRQDVLGRDAVCGVQAGPGFLWGLSGAGVLQGGGRGASAVGLVRGKAAVRPALIPLRLWEAVGPQVTLSVCAREVAVRGEPGPVDGALPPQLRPVLGVPQDAVCEGKGWSEPGPWVVSLAWLEAEGAAVRRDLRAPLPHLPAAVTAHCGQRSEAFFSRLLCLGTNGSLVSGQRLPSRSQAPAPLRCLL